MYCFDAFVHERAKSVYVLLVPRGDKDTIFAETSHPCVLQILEGEVLSLHRCQVVLLFRDISEIVDFVEDHNLRNLPGGASLPFRGGLG